MNKHGRYHISGCSKGRPGMILQKATTFRLKINDIQLYEINFSPRLDSAQLLNDSSIAASTNVALIM